MSKQYPIALLQLLESVAFTVKARFNVNTVQIWRLDAGTLNLSVTTGEDPNQSEKPEAFPAVVISSSEAVIFGSSKRSDRPDIRFSSDGDGVSQFFVGTKLFAQVGQPAIGALCLVHLEPLEFSVADQLLFEGIGAAVSALIGHPQRPDQTLVVALSAKKSSLLLNANHKVVAVNPRFTQLTGFKAEDLKSTFIDHLLCLDRPHSGALLLRHALLAGLSASGATRCRTNSGGTLPVETFIFPLLDENGAMSQKLLLLAPQFSGSIENFLLSLRESERADLLKQNIDGMWATDADGRITELSGKPFELRNDVSASSILGKRFDEIGVFESPTDWSIFYDALRCEAVPPDADCCVRDGKTYLWYRMSCFRQRSGDGLGYHGSFRNITESKLAQQAVWKSEQKFRELTALISDWYWALDNTHKFVVIDDRTHKMLGTRPEDTIGKARWEIDHYLVSKEQWAEHRSVLDSRIEFRGFEVQKRGVDGHVLWASLSGVPRFDDSGEFLGYHGVGRDITKRKLQDKALQDWKDRLALILEGTNDGAWDWDLVTGEYFLSPRWWHMIGFDDAEFPLTPELWMQFVHPDDKGKIQSVFRHAIATRSNAYQTEFRIKHRDGHWINVLGRGCILRNAEGKPIRTAGTNVDLTETLYAKRMLERAEARFNSFAAWSSDWFWEQDSNLRFTEIHAKKGMTIDLTLTGNIGKTRWELSSVHVTPDQWREHEQVLQSRQPFSDFSYDRTDSSGRSHWILVSGEPIFGQDGEFLGYRGVGKDITQRKIQEQALQESQLRLGLVLDGSTDGAWDVNCHTGTYYLSQRGLQILGYADGEFVFDDLTRRQIMHPADLDQFDKTLSSFIRGEDDVFSSQLRMLHRAGYPVPVLIRGKAIRDVAGSVVRLSGTLTDLTQQRQSEARIRLLEYCIQSLQDVVLITDASPRGQSGPRIVYVNDAFEKFTGYSREEAVGKNPRFLQGPDTSREELDRISDAMRQWHSIRTEVLNYKKNGDPVWIELEIVPVKADGDDWYTHWIGMQRDVTTRKLSERALQTTASRLSMVLRASDLGTWFTDLRTGKASKDDRWFTMLGHKPGSISDGADSWLALVHPEDVGALVVYESNAIKFSDEQFESQFRMRHSDGTWRWIQSHGKVISRDDQGKPAEIAGTHRDITRKVLAQQQATKMQSQLVQCLEAMPIGVLVTQRGAIQFANRAILTMLEIEDRNQLANFNFCDLVEESDRHCLDGRDDHLGTGQQVPSLWLRFKLTDGNGFRALVNCTALVWNDEHHILHTISQVGDADLLVAEVASVKSRYEGLLLTQLEEKQTDIARELHDSLGSQLAGISLQAAAIKMRSDKGLPQEKGIERLLENIKLAAELTRGLARGLVPVDDCPGSFWRALERLCADYKQTGALDCEFDMQGEFELVHAETGNHLYRISQEAITNAVRHGNAKRVCVQLTRDGSNALLCITDDGSGLNKEVAEQLALINEGSHFLSPNLVNKGLGVSSILARTRAINGRLTVKPTMPTGTCVSVQWPLSDTIQ